MQTRSEPTEQPCMHSKKESSPISSPVTFLGEKAQKRGSSRSPIISPEFPHPRFHHPSPLQIGAPELSAIHTREQSSFPDSSSRHHPRQQILVMKNQSFNGYTDLLQSDVGLDDLHWSGGHGEQHIDLEGHEEQHINLEETQEATPPVKASAKKARASKASAPKSSTLKRQKKFSQAKDLTLCDAYLKITQDPIIGVDQSCIATGKE